MLVSTSGVTVDSRQPTQKYGADAQVYHFHYLCQQLYFGHMIYLLQGVYHTSAPFLLL